MSKLFIEPASVIDALHVAANLREADMQEWQLLHTCGFGQKLGKTPFDSIAYGVSKGNAWACYDRNRNAVAIYGMYPLWGERYAPWLMATPLVAKHGRAALRIGRALRKEWQIKSRMLVNVVSKKHVRAINYIQACGYTLVENYEPEFMTFYAKGEIE